MRVWFLAVVASLLFAAAPVAAQTADDVNEQLDLVFGEHERMADAFAALQTAVKEGDAEAVAALVAYPLVVNVGPRREIASPEEFVAAYDKIMTKEIVDAVTEQAYEKLLVNDDGMMFGNGQVWISGVCQDANCDTWEPRIITIQSTGG